MAKYATIAAVAVVFASVCVAIVFAVENQRDKALTNQFDQAQSELLGLGSQITSIKGGNLTTPNDFIAAYTEIEPLEKEYDEKLGKFNQIYTTIRERDSHRSLLDIQRWRGTHHPETWEKMSEIIVLVRQINDITRREISVVHAMASLPAPERPRFWHEQFLPLAVQERELRERLEAVGRGRAGDSVTQ